MIGTFSALTSSLVTWNMFRNLRQRVILSGAIMPAEMGRLTLAIPVRNEEKNLRELIPALLAQDPRPAEILFLDDGSSDDTLALLTEMTARHPQLRVISGRALPDGWRGKVWALEQLLSLVRTEWVLFLDADVRLNEPGALAALWSTAAAAGVIQGTGFLSVFPRPRVTHGAAILVHQIHTHLYYFLPHMAERLRNPSAVAGCGQAMLLPVADLRALGGFASLSASTHDGLRLARLFKSAGRKVVAADGGGFVSARTYPDFKSAFRGFSRNDAEATGSAVGALLLSLVIYQVFVAPFALFPFLFLNPLWLASFVWLLYAQHRMAQEFGFGASHVPLTPVSGMASIGVHLWARARQKLGQKTDWRGRWVD